MSVRQLPLVALLLAGLGLAGCSGGGGDTGVATFDCGSANARVICLASCNLGCSVTGCARTDIAQNEIVTLVFSDDVDPNSVGPASIRFRTAAGSEPVGEFFVNGKIVEFVPTLSISGGQTFFGFSAGETYTMTIPGGGNQLNVVRSTSGKPFDQTITCTLQSTRGIVDLNGVAPRATLIVPPQTLWQAAPLDTDIVLEFNELIDATPFLGGGQIPVAFTVRRTLVNAGGLRECNPNAAPQLLTGTAVLDFDAGSGRSSLTFRPTVALPPNICVEIAVTDGVRDLSGRPAQPQLFTFRTIEQPLVEQRLTEDFDNSDNLDSDASSGSWGGGFATFAQIGGDGRHGSFNTLALDTGFTTPGGKRIWELDCDQEIIPATNTSTGSPLAVTDGRFFFTSMVVPTDVSLRFVGNNPPVITVAGRLEVLGEIDASGQSVTTLPVLGTPGQAGGSGGVFGGNGGRGGDRIITGATTGATFVHQGVNGQDARVIAGHAYAASVTASGGAGSTVFPASGLNNDLLFGAPTNSTSSSQLACVSAAAGGGGGGHRIPGGLGFVVSNNHTEPGLGNSPGQLPVNVSSATVNTLAVASVGYSLTNAALPWAANRYVGLTVEILSGLGAGQTRTIVSHTSTTALGVITVSPPWATIPGLGSTFRVLPNPATPLVAAIGPSAAGGSAVQTFPFPAVGGLGRSSLHFLVGGAGGGGSASHAAMCLNLARSWCQGLGGGGGGGAIALRAGRELRLSSVARLAARGGSAANNLGPAAAPFTPTPAPGGGGAGGSIVLQSAGIVQLAGPVDVRGGAGGNFNRFSQAPSTGPGTAPFGTTTVIEGGDGSDGFVRLEIPGTPSPALLATMLPAPTADNVAPLSERDDVVATLSKIYPTGGLFGPEYARYEIRAIVDGVAVVYSDDPAVSTVPATGPSPVRALFQAVQLDVSTGEVLERGPWRSAVRSSGSQPGISAESFNGYRFWLFADRALASDIVIDQVVIVIRV